LLSSVISSLLLAVLVAHLQYKICSGGGCVASAVQQPSQKYFLDVTVVDLTIDIMFSSGCRMIAFFLFPYGLLLLSH